MQPLIENQMPLLLEKPNCQRSPADQRSAAARETAASQAFRTRCYQRAPAGWVGILDFRDSRLAVKGGFPKNRQAFERASQIGQFRPANSRRNSARRGNCRRQRLRGQGAQFVRILRSRPAGGRCQPRRSDEAARGEGQQAARRWRREQVRPRSMIASIEQRCRDAAAPNAASSASEPTNAPRKNVCRWPRQ